MSDEQIKQELESKFPFLKDAVEIRRQTRISALVPLEKFEEVFLWLVKQKGFTALSALTGLDRGDAFELIYHLNREGSVVLNLKVVLDRQDPQINTITKHFPSADIYERELVDLLGIKVQGLAAGQRYPLTDDWPKDDHPLRKDWKGAKASAKEGQNA